MRRLRSIVSACALNLAFVAALVVLIPAMSGCGVCLVKMCRGYSNCRCTWDTCPSGTYFDDDSDTCVCTNGRVMVNSSCMTQDEANVWCGRGMKYDSSRCVAITCAAGMELDITTGQCLTRAQLNQVAQNMGIQVQAGETIGCKDGEELVVYGGQASCIPPESACTRGQTWNGKACVQTPQCPAGSLLSTQTGTCIQVSTSNSEYTTDLLAWTAATYGTNGGNGTASFCSGFNKKPTVFGVGPGGSVRVLVDVTVQAPSRSAGGAYAETRGRVEASRAAFSQKGAEEIQRAAEELLVGLHTQGGKVTVNTAQTTVRCLIVNSARPVAIPESGGL